MFIKMFNQDCICTLYKAWLFHNSSVDHEQYEPKALNRIAHRKQQLFQKKGLVCRHLYTKGNKVVAANKCKSQVNKYHKAGTTGRVQDGIMFHVTQNIVCEHTYFFKVHLHRLEAKCVTNLSLYLFLNLSVFLCGLLVLM